MEDLEDAWDFVKKEQLDSDDEEEELTPGLKEIKELTVEDVEKTKNALQAHMFIVAELKRKIEHELYMADLVKPALRREDGSTGVIPTGHPDLV